MRPLSICSKCGLQPAEVVLILWLAGAVAVSAFVVNVDEQGRVRSWRLAAPDNSISTNVINRQTKAIRYFIASDAYSAANREAELNAVRASFDQWQAVSGSTLKFEEAGFVAPGVDINTEDNTNLVFWAKNSTLVNGGLDDISSALGYAFYSYFDDNEVAESDIVLNGVNFSWSATIPASPGSYSIEAILLHEIGHFLGLEHSPAGGANMLARGESGASAQVGLSSDEIAAVRALYPQAGFLATLATLRGRVKIEGLGEVFGAVVTAENAAGNVIAGTLTRRDADGSGGYELPAMPPGEYQVRVTPLDPATGSWLLWGGDISWEYGLSAETSFLPAAPAPVSLKAGVTATQNFTVEFGTPTFWVTRLRPPTSDPEYLVQVNAPIAVRPGQSNVWVGVYSPKLPAAGASLSVSGDGLTLGSSTFRANVFNNLNLISVRISVASNATPGMRSFVVRQGANVAFVNGFLVIPPPIPDQNFDGLDDRFQRQYFPLFTAATAAPTADPDKDGYDNLAEYAAGTNPTNAASNPGQIPPTITGPPESHKVMIGDNVTFAVTVAGTPPFSYQWQYNGAPLTGATNSILLITNVQPAHSGAYVVVVSNASGSATSPAASLTVPTISVWQSSSSYTSPGETAVTCYVENQSGRPLLSLCWRPQVPQGWQLLAVSGQGYPRLENGAIGLTEMPTNNTFSFQYTASVPAGQTGPQEIRGIVEFQVEKLIVLESITVEPITIQGAGPLRLTITRPNLNVVLLSLSGENGRQYAVQISTNLAVWQPLTNFIATQSPVQFQDTATGNRMRFYRAQLRP